MDKTSAKYVDEYIALQPSTVQAALESVRRSIRKALPEAKETISYKMPAYKLHGAAVIYFAGWKNYFSIYPANERLIAAFKDDLASYEIHKSTVHFPFSKPVPAALIERIARFRASEIAERAKAKA